MVASKKLHCVICSKKCSGNVLRYQDQYYHKQCFELEQSQGSGGQELYVDSKATRATERQAHPTTEHSHSSQSPTLSSSNHNNNTNQPTGTMNNSTGQATITSNMQHQISKGGSQSRKLDSSRSISNGNSMTTDSQRRSQTIDSRFRPTSDTGGSSARSATLPHSISSPNGFPTGNQSLQQFTSCAGCGQKIKDGQALIALDLHWHVWCFKCFQCQTVLHGEYVAKDGKAYCEKDYQRLFGVTCVYCKRYITGKVLQAGEAHHFHPSCARCSKCGDPFVPGEEMYLQGEITWHPRCGPGPDSAIADEFALESVNRSQMRAVGAQSPSLSSRSRSRSASPFSYMSRQYGRASPGYTDSEAVGDLSRVYTISYLNADPAQGYLRRPVEPNPPKSPQFSRPTSGAGLGNRSRSSSRSAHYYAGSSRDRSVPRGMYSVLSGMRGGGGGISVRARSPSMMNEEAIHLAQYPSGQKPSPDSVPKIERDDFPAPPFPYPDRVRGGSQLRARDEPQLLTAEPTAESRKQQPQQRASRPRSREIVVSVDEDDDDEDPQLKKEEEELSKIANGIGKIFLKTLKDREKIRAWKRANLDPRNASRTPSATRELPSRLRYENPTNASPSRDMDRPRPWEEEELAAVSVDHSPTRTRSSLGKPSQMSSSTYNYKVVQSNRSTPKPGYGLSSGPYDSALRGSEMSFSQQQRSTQNRSADLLNRGATLQAAAAPGSVRAGTISGSTSARSNFCSPHLRRSMPNVTNLYHLHQEGPPKLYPYHLLATSNYRLPPDVDRCHLERHLSNEEFQYIFHCDRLDFYRLPEWKRNELKRRAKLF